MSTLALGVRAITGGEPRELVEDECARCGCPVLALDTVWRVCESDAGLLATANWCSPACQQRAIPSVVVARLRARRGNEP